MFKKILIANRGEIACRVITTARRMGIATVAVYSDADARAPFVRMADEAVHIGPAAAAESHFVADKIIEACKQTGAEAVHPGYGFLSERASFVEALEKENIAFIGPRPGPLPPWATRSSPSGWPRMPASTPCRVLPMRSTPRKRP